MTEQYTLTCEKCGQPYISSDGFPRLQWCPSCSKGQLNLETLRERLAEILFQADYVGKELKPLSECPAWLQFIYYGIVQTQLETEPLALVIKLLDLTRDKCPECKGEGWIPITVGNNDGGGGCHEEQDTCPSCHGTGRVGDWNIERLWIK